jgi:hypothetical protein
VEENNIVQISFAEAVCGIMAAQTPRARRPSARALLGPVRALLGGETSPADFSVIIRGG